jgi:hypothetical protein
MSKPSSKESLLQCGFERIVRPKCGVNDIVCRQNLSDARFALVTTMAQSGKFLAPVAKLSEDLHHHKQIEKIYSQKYDFENAEKEAKIVDNLQQKVDVLTDKITTVKKCLRDAKVEMGYFRQD